MNRLLVLIGVLFLITFAASCDKSTENITITKIDPTEARVGETVRIIGTGFNNLKRDSGDVIRIYFEGVEITGSYLNDTSIYVNVPPGVQPGPICVMHEGTKICSPVPFTIIAGNQYSNSFVQLANHPGTFNLAAASLQAGKNIYVGHTNWWKYDIQNNAWSPAPVPTDKVARAASFTINGKGYLFGGTPTTGGVSNRLQVFDETTNSWSFAAPLPGSGRANAAVCVLNNKAYIAGGTDNGNNPAGNTVGKELWEYDPATNSWTRKADLLHELLEGSIAIKLGNYFYLPGSGGANAQEYNLSTNAWRNLSSPSFPLKGYVFFDKDFELAYVVAGKYICSCPYYWSGNSNVYRVALNYDRSQLLFEHYASLPSRNSTMWEGAGVVYNHELYYGLGFTDPNVGTESHAWWRYRY